MACCGKNRKKKGRREILVKYTGWEDEYALKGLLSGRIYRFPGNGARLEIERRDWNALTKPGPLEVVKNIP
jgi:hypothetical protein